MRNHFPGQIEGMVRLPRLGLKAGAPGGGSGLPIDTIIAIAGYFNGMISNQGGLLPTGQPVWDGTYRFRMISAVTPLQGMAAVNIGGAPAFQMSGFQLCNAWITGPVAGVYTMEIDQSWIGTSSNLIGLYTNNGSVIGSTPATLSLVEVPGVFGEHSRTACSN